MWACPDCIRATCDGLDIEPPEVAVVRAPAGADSDVDSDPESDDDGGMCIFEDVEPTAETEADMHVVDGIVFGVWSIAHLRMLLNVLTDFKNQISRIAEVISARGHLCMFIPKFYCELNFIELYWCLAKWHTRGRSDMSWEGLKKAIWEAFGVVEFDNPTGKALPTCSLVRQRESRRSREYLAAYRRGANVQTVDVIRNEIKLRRRVYRQHRVPSQAGTRDSIDGTMKKIIRCGNCGVIGHNRRGCKRYWSNM